MAPIKVGLMGYGFSTKCFHLPFITPNPDLEVFAFLQRAEAPADKTNVEAGKHCTVDHPKAKHYRTADAFFADPAIELVIVCTSSDNHAEFAEKAMRSGKHGTSAQHCFQHLEDQTVLIYPFQSSVVVEKPFTTTSSEATALIATSHSTGKILTVFQNRRYDSDFRTLQRIVSSNCLGEITEFQNHYDMDYPDWVRGWTSKDVVPGQGMLYGLGTHSIDQTLLLFGRPRSVTAFTRVLREVGGRADDSFTVVLQYGPEGGDGKEGRADLICTVKTTIVSTLPMERQLKFMVRGREGTFLKVSWKTFLSSFYQFLLLSRYGQIFANPNAHRTAKIHKSTSSSRASKPTMHLTVWSRRSTTASCLPKRNSTIRRSRTLRGYGVGRSPARRVRTWVTTETLLPRSEAKKKLL
jgi:predicted dehydrogenase